ncbi:MAG: phosphonate ABC transporter substrate-binding protein [Moorellaceae bacterium]
MFLKDIGWKKIIGLAILGILFLLTAGCGNEDKAGSTGKPQGSTASQMTELKVSFVPVESAEEIVKRYQGIVDYLSKELNMKVTTYVANDYAAVIEAMRARHVDVAWFGPFSYILASNEAGAEAFVNPIGENGLDVYYSLFITHKDSGIKSLQDLKGKSFSFGDPASTSGHLIPRYIMVKSGLNPDKDMKVQFSGGHDATALAVKNKKVDAGAMASEVYDRLVEKNIITPDEVRIFLKSEALPLDPWAYRKDLPQEFKEKVKKALLEIHQKAPDALKGTNFIKFQEVDDSRYDIIREVAKNLNLDLKKLK